MQTKHSAVNSLPYRQYIS
uniref:Uncharacterized protein n=1 Tax=Arundo donax TaxID=35708 RepID=A0A0A8YBP8_ARUDO